jgi:MFS family permease
VRVRVPRLPVARGIAVLGAVSLLTDVAGEMVTPLVPLYLAALGAGALALGLVEGAAEAAVSLLKVGSGRLADRLPRRKPLVVLGYALTAVARPALALAGAWPQVLALRTADRVGKGVRGAPRDAMIADLAPEGKRGLAFGVHRAADSLGAVVGPLLALALLWAWGQGLDALRMVILLTAIPMGAAVLLLVVGVPEPRVHRPKPAAMGALPRAYWATLAALGVFALGRVAEAFFVLRASELGASAVEAVALYVAFNLVYAAASIPLGSLGDRRGRLPLLGGAMLLFALTCALAAMAPSWPLLLPAFLLLGLVMAAYETAGRAAAVDLAPKESRGTALGWYHGALGLAALPAGLAVGALWESVGPWAGFAWGAALAVLAAALLALAGWKGRAAARRNTAAAGGAP